MLAHFFWGFRFQHPIQGALRPALTHDSLGVTHFGHNAPYDSAGAAVLDLSENKLASK